jgi:hypothetical protein
LVVDGDDHVWFDGALDRQVAGGQRQVAELDQGVGQALGAGAGIAGAAARGRDGLQGGRDLVPADRVQRAAQV